MAFFQTLNSNINLVTEMILNNVDLCKLIGYDNNDPLSNPPIPITRDLLMDRVFPLPKDPAAIVDKKSIINAYFYMSEPYHVNSGFRKIELRFDIMSHIDLWMIDGGIRTYSMSNYIDEMFNNVIIAQLSGKAVYFKGWKAVKYSEFYYGYHLVYELSDNSNVGCL